MNTYYYTVDDDNGIEDAYEFRDASYFDFNDDFDMKMLAQECADDYWNEHAGWEYTSWSDGSTPIKITLWLDQHPQHTFEVWVEVRPDFIAVKNQTVSELNNEPTT